MQRRPLVVMKFGGSSVAGPERIRRVAERVIQRRRAGHQVVAVVSAPGDMTDDLLTLAKGVCDEPDARELDMLLATGEQVSIALVTMAIKHRRVKAISLTGPQAGILADTQHTQARIIRIEPSKIHRELSRHRVVVVAGFQGLNPNEDITTLGRGGSDLTAVALAAALKGERCEVYTDVQGVYTADPRVVSAARKIDQISYDEMLELAGSGAQVMQARSIEVAKKFGVPVYVRSTFLDDPGTLITSFEEGSRMEEVVVTGVSFDRNQARLSM
ncbi:MAG: aspartate kinase, partial [Elusimicrobia bacterium]|nr:aspartate kinase [Elusimicrobiota bacterium]